MRALAPRLGVAPNALYSHVENKAQLLDDLLDDVLSLIEVPDQNVGDPLEGLSRLMSSTYTVLTSHPDLVPLFLARQGARGENAVRLGETMDTFLVRAGITGKAASEARRVLIVHTIGFAAFHTGGAVVDDVDRPIPVRESRGNFSKSLGWLLAGIVQNAVRSD